MSDVGNPPGAPFPLTEKPDLKVLKAIGDSFRTNQPDPVDLAAMRRQNRVGNLLAELLIFTRDTTTLSQAEVLVRRVVANLEDIYRENPITD